MRLALVWPESTFLIDPMVYPPLGLWYVWACLRQRGHLCHFYDMDAHDNLPGGYDAYLFSGTTPQAARIRHWAAVLKGRGERTILGGPHATMHSTEMAHWFDGVVKGEVMPYNVDSWLGEEGIIDLGRAPDLDSLPLPVRDAAWDYRAFLEGQPCTTAMTSWGCPFNCAFCSTKALLGRKVRYVPLPAVLEDLGLVARMGFGAVQFYDDILPLQPGRTLAIAQRLRQLELKWRCFLRSDLGVKHGFSFLEKLAKANLVEVLVGVESASNEVKRRINKGTTQAQDTQLLEWCQELDIKFKASIILGLPGETMATMQETADWLLEHRPDRVDVNTLIPMPGTPIFDKPEEYHCKWTEDVPDEYFFKGREGEVACLVETEALTAVQIADFRLELLGRLRAEGIGY